MTCPACHQTETQGCKSCRAQSLARIFLAKGERGQKLRRACEQLGVTVEEVREAWASDPSNPKRKP